jgi:hypothetical protein
MSLIPVAVSFVAFMESVPSAVNAYISEPVRMVILGVILILLSRSIRVRLSRPGLSRTPEPALVETPVRAPLNDSLARTA